jgi:type IV secretory pathway VirB4 component
METYEQKGITTENDSLYKNIETGELKEMPTLGDLASIVAEHAKTDKTAQNIKIMLSMFTQGSAKKFNGQTNVDLTTGFTVFDLEDLGNDPELLPMGMLIATNVVKQYFSQDRTEKKVLFIDEFWSMIGAGAPESTAWFLVKMCKIVRGMSGAVFLATQDINDIYAQKDSVYGKNVLNACATQMFMMVGDMDARQLANIFNLTVNEEQAIRKNQKGDMLFCTASGQKVPIHIEASQTETEAITTDRKLMVEVAKKAKAMKEAKAKGAEQ